MREPFHDGFLEALRGDAAALAPWASGPAAEAGLAVYRNTIARGCAEALAAQFPTVARVVGPDWLTAAAARHAQTHPPREASLLAYGDAFPDWLDGFPPAAKLPYLADLARLDWLWTGAHLAADADPLDAAQVAALTAEDFSRRGLRLHPATRAAWFETSIPALWQALQPPAEAPAHLELGDEPQGLLLTRPGLEVGHRRIGAGAYALLAASRGGASLADAAVAALLAEPGLDLAQTFAALVDAGAFGRLIDL